MKSAFDKNLQIPENSTDRKDFSIKKKFLTAMLSVRADLDHTTL